MDDPTAVPAPPPSDGLADLFPVSVKGVLFLGDRVVLLKNERREWELPGGKLDRGEDPAVCVVRELAEELSVAVTLGPILDSWLYDIQGRVQVVIITYACRAPDGLEPDSLEISHEHKALGLFGLDEIDGLAMPEGYRRSIRSAAQVSSGVKV